MSAAIRRNWKTIVPIFMLLLAILFGVGVMNLLRADDEPPSPPPIFPDTSTQSITHLPGVDQWFQFTFNERTSLTFTTTEASPDTALLLYGPGDSNTLYNAHWPDYITGFRVLSQVGNYALEAGTYYLQVTELAGGLVPVPFTVEYFTGAPTNTSATVVLDQPPAEFDPTNAPALAISSTPQLFTHSPGVDQWFQFTLLEPCEVTFTAVDAGLDTAILLYGPADPSLLVNGAWPDFFTSLRSLSQTGANALAPGTYYLLVTDLAGGIGNSPFAVEYLAMPVSSITPDTNTVFLMTPEVLEAGAFTLPVFAGSTNDLLEIMPGAEWQSFDYVIGTTQWVYFTLTQRTDLSVYLDMAGPDTMLWLYGPDSATNLSAMVPADPAAYWRVLEASGSNALAVGTYLLAVVEPVAEPTTNTYPIWFTASLTPEVAPTGSPGGDPGTQAAGGSAVGTAVNVTFIVTQKGVPVGGVAIDCESSNNPAVASMAGGKTAGNGALIYPLRTGQRYQVKVGKSDPWEGGIWSFAGPADLSVSKATTINIEATLRPNFGVSGVTREDSGQPLSGVQLNFSSVSALPHTAPSFKTLVSSAANGTWTNRAFAMNYSYRVTPSKADANWSWAFTPASLVFSSHRTDLNFTGKRVGTFAMSGSVTDTSTGARVNGALITFQNLSFPNDFCPKPTVTTNLGLSNGAFPVYQSGLWRQSGFATNIGYRVTPKVSATNNSSGGKWTFTPEYLDVTNASAPINFTARYVENPANLYPLSGRVVNTATSSGVPGVLVHFSMPYFGFASVPAPVFTDANGNWRQTDFQKSNITGQVTYQIAASLNTNYQAGPGTGWAPTREGVSDGTNQWIISEAIYSPPTAGNLIAVNSQSRKTDLNFLVTRHKYAFDYTLVMASNLTVTASQMAAITNGLRSAANYLYDATDGQAILRNINIQKATNNLTLQFKEARIQICPPLLTNRTHVLTLYSTNNGVITTYKQMRLDINACGTGLYATFVHELGHLEFNLYDEYTLQLTCTNHTHVLSNLVSNTSTQRYDHSWSAWVDKSNVAHTNLVRSCPPCIMDGNYSSEFCKPGTHTNSPVNSQQQYHGKSCWETMKAEKPLLALPNGLPLPGPGATAADNKVPLPGDQSTARHLRITLP